MNRILKSLLLVGVFCQFGYAQTQPTNESPFTENSQALQFSIGDNFTLHSFQGATISYKHHLQPLTALRVGLSVSVGGSSSETTMSNSSADAQTNGVNSTQDLTNIQIQLGAQKIWYVQNPTAVLFYFGGGPFGIVNHNSTNRVDMQNPSGSSVLESTTEQSSTGWSVGIAGLAGVECFAAKSISLHAEYGVNFAYSRTKSESTQKYVSPSSTTKSDATINSWQFSSPGVTFGLSVYF